jgi:hypothetical protein
MAMPREIAVAPNGYSENSGDEVPVTEAKRSFFTLSVHSIRTHEHHQLKLRFNNNNLLIDKLAFAFSCNN